MAVKKSYNRYFIIFQEEDKGYGIAIDKQPTGYTKIENRSSKCKVTVYAQNLVKEKGPYYCCLVDSTKDPIVMAKLGAINIDDTGRGETWWEFKEDDIADTGVAYDRFNIAAVITEENKVNAPLAGYIGKDKVSWKDRVPFVARKEEPVVEEKPQVEEEPIVEEEPEVLDEEAKKFKEYEEDINANKDNGGERWKKEKENKDKDNKEESKASENKKENAKGESKSKDDNKHENKEDKKDNEKSKDDNKKENPKSQSEKAEVKKENLKEHENKDNKKEDSKKEDKNVPKSEAKEAAKDNPKDNPAQKLGNQPNVIQPFNYDEDIEAKEVSGYIEDGFNKDWDRKGDKDNRPFATMFHDILEDFDEEDELTDEFKGVRWWKIPLSDDIQLSENAYYPYYCAIYHLKMTYPYINYIKHFKDTGHYHFGMKYDKAGEVKYILYGIEGRNTPNLQPYMGMTGFIRWIKMKDRDKGMWIMYYNPRTGNIMIPTKR